MCRHILRRRRDCIVDDHIMIGFFFLLSSIRRWQMPAYLSVSTGCCLCLCSVLSITGPWFTISSLRSLVSGIGEKSRKSHEMKSLKIWAEYNNKIFKLNRRISTIFFFIALQWFLLWSISWFDGVGFVNGQTIKMKLTSECHQNMLLFSVAVCCQRFANR